MFDSAGNMLGCWCNNDANWRSEYFNPMMESLGFTISGYPDDSAELENAIIQIRDFFGFEYCDEDEDEDENE